MSFIQTRDDMAALFQKWEDTNTTDNKFRKYCQRERHKWLLEMYDRFGHEYFTPLQWIILSFDDKKINDWIDWVQRSKGDYL